MTTKDEYEVLERKYTGMATVDLIRAMDLVRSDKDSVEEKLSAINKEFDYLRLNIIPQRMDDDGVSSMKVDGVGRCTIASDIYASIKADRKQDAFLWLSDNGRGSLVTTTVNSSSLKAAMKEIIRKGETPPEDLFNVTPFSRVSITKS